MQTLSTPVKIHSPLHVKCLAGHSALLLNLANDCLNPSFPFSFCISFLGVAALSPPPSKSVFCILCPHSNILLPIFPVPLLCTGPSHLRLACLTLSPSRLTCAVPLVTSLLILSVLVTPKENLSIFSSATSTSVSHLDYLNP